MKKKIALICIIVMLVLPVIFLTGCQKAAEKPTDTFATTYNLAEAGRSISLSGNSNGVPGEHSEYTLKINNGTERWQDEYYVLLVDNDSVIQEISHERFDIPGGGGIQQPLTITFPGDFQGALGLCVLVPQRASMITTLSAGEENAIGTGWPDIHTYPSLQTPGGN
jgi:hypothetical protein